MEILVNALRSLRSERIDFWLSGQFDRKPHESDEAIATWTQLMGRDSAELWLAARQEANN
jgi:hypothetical protein